jgi:hypothetical protein
MCCVALCVYACYGLWLVVVICTVVQLCRLSVCCVLVSPVGSHLSGVQYIYICVDNISASQPFPPSGEPPTYPLALVRLLRFCFQKLRGGGESKKVRRKLRPWKSQSLESTENMRKNPLRACTQADERTCGLSPLFGSGFGEVFSCHRIWRRVSVCLLS